jgi:hypothetical protein
MVSAGSHKSRATGHSTAGEDQEGLRFCGLEGRRWPLRMTEMTDETRRSLAGSRRGGRRRVAVGPVSCVMVMAVMPSCVMASGRCSVRRVNILRARE